MADVMLWAGSCVVGVSLTCHRAGMEVSRRKMWFAWAVIHVGWQALVVVMKVEMYGCRGPSCLLASRVGGGGL